MCNQWRRKIQNVDKNLFGSKSGWEMDIVQFWVGPVLTTFREVLYCVTHELARNILFCQLINYLKLVKYWLVEFHSFIPLACAECDNSLPFSGASSIPLCYVLFSATFLHQLFFHPLSPNLAICFLVYLSILLIQDSYIIIFWEFYFLPFSIYAQTNAIYLNLLSLL